MESPLLGTFYPLDIKEGMPGCVITDRKINAKAHTAEISFSSTNIFKEEKKKETVAHKNDSRSGGLTRAKQTGLAPAAQTDLALFPS